MIYRKNIKLLETLSKDQLINYTDNHELKLNKSILAWMFISTDLNIITIIENSFFHYFESIENKFDPNWIRNHAENFTETNFIENFTEKIATYLDLNTN